MSLRTDYYGALDAGLLAARDAGIAAVTNDIANITTALQNAGNVGKKTFLYQMVISYQPTELRSQGDTSPLWYAYHSGVVAALNAEDLFENEVTVSLNTNDTVTLKLDLDFTF